jgi:Flp pilus assembly protein protease CpaA
MIEYGLYSSLFLLMFFLALCFFVFFFFGILGGGDTNEMKFTATRKGAQVQPSGHQQPPTT